MNVSATFALLDKGNIVSISAKVLRFIFKLSYKFYASDINRDKNDGYIL